MDTYYVNFIVESDPDLRLTYNPTFCLLFDHVLMNLTKGPKTKLSQSLKRTYVGLQNPLQQEWAFMQWVAPDIGHAFGPVKTYLQDTSLPALLQGKGEGILGRWVTRLPVKQAGLSLPDPTKTAPKNWTASCVVTVHISTVPRG